MTGGAAASLTPPEIDPLFWSSVDIVDSILAERRDLAQARFYHLQIKSDLVALLRADPPATVRLFHDHGYPSLAAHERKPFIADLLALIEREQDAVDPFSYMMLKGGSKQAAPSPNSPSLKAICAMC